MPCSRLCAFCAKLQELLGRGSERSGRQRQDDVAIDFPVAGPPAQASSEVLQSQGLLEANIREDDLSDHDKLAETEESMNDLELSDQLDDQLVANTDAPAEQHDAWTANQEDQSEHQSDDGMVLDEQTEFAQQVPDAPMAEEVSINEVEQNPILSPQANASPVPFCEGMPKCQDDMLEPDEAARGDDVENEEEEQAESPGSRTPRTRLPSTSTPSSPEDHVFEDFDLNKDGVITREEFDEVRSKILKGETLSKASLAAEPDLATQEAAAGKIQAIYRGRMVREQAAVPPIRSMEAPSKICRALLGYVYAGAAAMQKDLAEQEVAAGKIQAIYRGRMAREQAAQAAQAAKKPAESEADLAEQEAAAGKIQAIYRGRMAREQALCLAVRRSVYVRAATLQKAAPLMLPPLKQARMLPEFLLPESPGGEMSPDTEEVTILMLRHREVARQMMAVQEAGVRLRLCAAVPCEERDVVEALCFRAWRDLTQH